VSVWKEIKAVPNEPGQMVSVVWTAEATMRYGPKAGTVIKYSSGLVGSSAREVSAEDWSEKVPVTWRFFCGKPSGGDDLKAEPAWDEFKFEVAAKTKDARKTLEAELGIKAKSTWYVLQVTD
jgi:hypothetical protein